jgi:two-component sensor histidine kinase
MPAQEDTMPELVPHLPFAEEPLLLDELNHRINNEFASLIGFVSVAASASANDEVKRALRGVAQLVQHYADVHHILQLPDRAAFVDAADYLGELCRAISRSKLGHTNIQLMLSAAPLSLESDRCWRLGMIVSELITNAAQHAFAGRSGQIRVELFRAGRLVKCTVRDDGSAPAHVQAGRGLRIVEALAKAIDGRVDRTFGPGGSAASLIFPYHPAEKAGTEERAPVPRTTDLGSLRTARATTR